MQQLVSDCAPRQVITFPLFVWYIEEACTHENLVCLLVVNVMFIILASFFLFYAPFWDPLLGFVYVPI
jgi:hypothetical protein